MRTGGVSISGGQGEEVRSHPSRDVEEGSEGW